MAVNSWGVHVSQNYWFYNGSVKTVKQGLHSHAESPKNSLADLYEDTKMTNDGYYKNESHHLKGLTLWNYKRGGYNKQL